MFIIIIQGHDDYKHDSHSQQNKTINNNGFLDGYSQYSIVKE